ncbi:hypothetical protein Acr_19g0006180 [Actinidia rufa]|uniref:Uncharacterized protein n=1 Tax=Actinidia rufa TaxID=165716 RepID=A0A7J0GAA3_9ERIC|nr:hypothetical protein Acr_19g0006180 [Actinidia rufa]
MRGHGSQSSPKARADKNAQSYWMLVLRFICRWCPSSRILGRFVEVVVIFLAVAGVEAADTLDGSWKRLMHFSGICFDVAYSIQAFAVKLCRCLSARLGPPDNPYPNLQSSGW